jgi:hypothetical protein
MPRLITGFGATIDQAADIYGVDPDVLVGMARRAKEAWEWLSKWYPKAECECHMAADLSDEVTLRGTSDLVSVAGHAVLDWKFGWSPSEHPNQIRSYAYLLRDMHGMPDRGYILGAEVWVRIGEVRIHKFRDEDLDRLRDELLAQVADPNRYGPSYDACRYCPRQMNCRAKDEWTRSGITALEAIDDESSITPTVIADLYDRSRVIGRALRHYDKVLKSMIASGPVVTSDGREITIDQQEQDYIRPSKAMRILREELKLTKDEVNIALKITKSGLQEVLKGRAPKGKAAAYMRETLERLCEVGAVEKVTKPRIKVSKS